jgi:hypothetical protein
MFSRRLAQRASTLTPTTVSATRPFSSTVAALDKHNKHAKSPALADVTPDNAHVFDQRTQEFRTELAERNRREREQHESASASAAKAAAEAKQSSSPNTASSSSAGGLDSQSAAAPSSSAAGQNDPKQKKVGSGPLSKLIYGTEEGRKMDQEIERSFSQVLARGKYVHSIVFHEVKPSKVDEYVELVGNWYPKMANMPENKVRGMANGSQFFGRLTRNNRSTSSAPGAPKSATATLSSTSGSTSATPATTNRSTRSRTTPSLPSSTTS